MDNLITISAQIPTELDKNLSIICQVEERTKSYFIRKALEKLLKEKLEDLEDYAAAEKAYNEFKKSKEKGIPYQKVFKKIK